MVHLYGVTHGMSKHMAGISVGKVIFLPSRELVSELRRLPKGTIVGIENLPHHYDDSIDVDGEEIEFLPDSIRYWRDIEIECVANGLGVVFLDEPDLMRSYIRKLKEAQELDKKIQATLRRAARSGKSLSARTREKVWLLEQNAYRLVTEGSYIHAIDRETKIAENIAKARLHSALVGMAHGDYFFTRRDELAKMGIVIDSYSKDDRPEHYEPLMFQPEVVHARFVEDATPDETLLAERDGIIRRYNAVKHARVLPDREPQFIGTWDRDILARGLFEVYVIERNGNLIAGYIEDCFGSADFTGQISNGQITLTKVYNTKSIVLGGAELPVVYQGNLGNDGYEGTYRIHDGQGYSEERQFWMRPFECHRPNEINPTL